MTRESLPPLGREQLRHNQLGMYYETGVRGRLPLPDSLAEQFFRSAQYPELHAALSGAIDAGQRGMVGYIGCTVIARLSSETIYPAPDSPYGELWLTAEEFLTGQQGSFPV